LPETTNSIPSIVMPSASRRHILLTGVVPTAPRIFVSAPRVPFPAIPALAPRIVSSLSTVTFSLPAPE
jgi:hypothetical protein